MADTITVLHAEALILNEYRKAAAKFPAFRSSHEGYAILKEEVDELWDAVKQNHNVEALRDEATQVAAMALRFIVDLT
jgi:hypothetical protein